MRILKVLLPALALFSLLPVFSVGSQAPEKDLLADTTTRPTTAPVLPPMTAEQMHAAGERATTAAARFGWRLGIQAWTFNRRSFFQSVDAAHELGLHYIEGYPGQRVDADPKVVMGPDLPEPVRQQIRKKLADADVKLVSFGVIPLKNKEADSRKVFDFAKDMGIENIVSEPGEDAFDMLNKLVEEYQINIAIHDHPKPSHYWNPDTVLKVVDGKSTRIGACADVGHWQRSGVNPIDALKKLQGRIIESHFKDLNSFGEKSAIDVPWGTGTGNAMGMLEELHHQGAKILFSVEYEHYSTGLMNDVARSVDWFGQACEKIAAESPEKN
jgi:sugar phosphate isomerase/epimerase